MCGITAGYRQWKNSQMGQKWDQGKHPSNLCLYTQIPSTVSPGLRRHCLPNLCERLLQRQLLLHIIPLLIAIVLASRAHFRAFYFTMSYAQCDFYPSSPNLSSQNYYRHRPKSQHIIVNNNSTRTVSICTHNASFHFSATLLLIDHITFVQIPRCVGSKFLTSLLWLCHRHPDRPSKCVQRYAFYCLCFSSGRWGYSRCQPWL